MGNDLKSKDSGELGTVTGGLLSRRDLLVSLGKWSKIVIGAAVFGGALLNAGREAESGTAWANHRGGGGGGAWANRGGGGGTAWANRGGGGGVWVNHGGGAVWANRGIAWANRGGSWVNRY